MSKEKKAVLLINLGTPDSPSVRDVRVYLREFLMDRRVIDIPFLTRFFLVNGIIAPFRAPESAKGYEELWLPEGSPLKIYGLKVQELLQKELGDAYQVFFAMRYQNPGTPSVLKEIANKGCKDLLVVPLYPQYASASTGSSIEEVMKEVQKWEIIPNIKFISQFFDHPLFIQAFAEKGKAFLDKERYDHVLFSYHGLPERQILKGSCDNYCRLGDCCSAMHSKNRYCYRAQSYATTRLLAATLGLSEENYSVSFQSRLGKDPWIKPYTDEVLKSLCQKGVKRILVYSPAFVADCLETTVEISSEYKTLFLREGGEHLDMVESLNDSPAWIACLKDLVLSGQGGET